jgi:hypothetical protein
LRPTANDLEYYDANLVALPRERERERESFATSWSAKP